MRRTTVALAALLICVGGCFGCSDTNRASAADAASSSAPGAEVDGEKFVPAIDLIEELPTCDVEHRGVLLDMGSDALIGAHGWQLRSLQSVVSARHQGATWARIYDRTLDLSFTTTTTSPVFVSLRAVGRDARSATISIDGQLVNTVRLDRDEPSVRTSRTTKEPLEAGLHHLRLRFHGRKQKDADPFAEIDWIRIGVPDELDRTYGAPTQVDLLAPAAKVGGVPHRGLALRAPGAVRCTLRVPPEGRFRAAVGMRGTGSAKVAIRMAADDEREPKVLQWIEVDGGDEAQWTDLDLPLDAFEDRIATLQVVATESTGTGRLLVGDPAIVVPERTGRQTAPARTVVLVIFDGVERQDLPPWRGAPTPHMPTLSRLSESATLFDDHRAPSSLVAAVVASLVSGLSPPEHQLYDTGAKLPDTVQTLGSVARNASVRAAMFTGVPTTFEVFGFAGGWEHFQQYSPNGGRLASAPIDDAADWIADAPTTGDEEHPLLVVIHARGGHPPWELTPPEASHLPPVDYTGFFGPRRAAESLADVRERRGKLSEEDRVRMQALFFAGLTRQDEALARLIARLEELDRWESSLFVVTGDVSSGRDSLFVDGGELDEHHLVLPLYVHFPDGLRAGERIDRPTEIYDVRRAALAALGIVPPPGTRGTDLAAIASGTAEYRPVVRAAFVDEQYSVRWGPFALRGENGDRPSLCDLRVDPLCSFDRRRSHPLVTNAMFRRLAHRLADSSHTHQRQPVTIDSETAAQLKVWGLY